MPGHELLRAAKVGPRSVLGAPSALVGYEFDGIDPRHAPPGLAVLGRAEPNGWDVGGGTGRLMADSNAAMVTFQRGRGTVFNAGTTDWARVLAWGDVAVNAVTRAVVSRLSDGDR
jgi:hypothetical protein